MSILSNNFYYQPLKIDSVNTQVYGDFIAKEGDADGRGLLVTLTENGLQKDTTGITLNLKWAHTTVVGLQGLDPFESIDLTKGLYKITYPTNMLRKGKVDAFIQIIDSGSVIGSRNIKINVEATVGDDTAIESSNEFAALASALVEVQGWNARIDDVEQQYIDKANNLDAIYPTRLVSLETGLEQTPVLSGNPATIWKAPTQPESSTIAPGGTVTVKSYYDKYDMLVTDFPDYITKTSIGKDQSGVYDIYKYVFEPPNYEKTIILSSLIHGSERAAFKGLKRVMHHICYDHALYPQLAYLRNNVRIVVVPVINPYGLSTASRYNVNGVDINRNFDYNWSAKTYYGSAPFSESETVALKMLLESYPEAHLYFDFHNTETRQDTAQMYTAIPLFNNSAANLYSRVMHACAPVTPVTILDNILEPTNFNYFAEHFNLLTGSVEWIPGAFDPVDTVPDITHMVEFFGNMIVQGTLSNDVAFKKVAEPKTILMTGALTTKATAATTWEEITELAYTLYPTVNGIIEIYANFNHINEDVTSQNFFACTIEQNRNDRYATNSGNSGANLINLATQQYNTEVFIEGNGKRAEASLLYAGKVIVPNTLFANPARIKFYWKTTAGSLMLRRERILIKFIPTDDVRAFEHWREVTAGAITEDYPGTRF